MLDRKRKDDDCLLVLTGIIILIGIGATIYIMNVFQHKAVINKNDKERS